MWVLRDFKSLKVLCLDAGSIKSLFWKYFFFIAIINSKELSGFSLFSWNPIHLNINLI